MKLTIQGSLFDSKIEADDYQYSGNYAHDVTLHKDRFLHQYTDKISKQTFCNICFTLKIIRNHIFINVFHKYGMVCVLSCLHVTQRTCG